MARFGAPTVTRARDYADHHLVETWELDPEGIDLPVNVYRLVADNTIEDKVVALQERKRDLFDRVVDGEGGFAAPLTAEDVRGLLDLP